MVESAPPVSLWSACFLLLFARRIFSDIFAGSQILAGNSPAGPPAFGLIVAPTHFSMKGQGGREMICIGQRTPSLLTTMVDTIHHSPYTVYDSSKTVYQSPT